MRSTHLATPLARVSLCLFMAAAQGLAAELTTNSPLRLPADLAKIVPNPDHLRPPEGLTVAAYVFPNYHASALHNELYAQGWTEYTLIRNARPWFPGHQQPRTPLLGELDEALPSTWERYNDLAADHGVDAFIWDWYWYDGKPALHEALEQGFLNARNRKRVKFAVMWTNHPWYILFPTVDTTNRAAYPPSFDSPDFSVEEARRSMAYIISRYFHQPNYWRINDKPVLCIWDPGRIVKRLGLEASQQLFAGLREFATQLGHPGIYIHASGFYSPDCRAMGFDSFGSYNPTDWVSRTHQPTTVEFPDYEVAAADVVTRQWAFHAKDGNIPYLPGLGVGWDSTPRYALPATPRPSSPNRNTWPACSIMANESPAAFKAHVQAGLAFLHQHPDTPRVLTVACWNEWSEGHYLLPDNRFGYGMLKALAEAVKPR